MSTYPHLSRQLWLGCLLTITSLSFLPAAEAQPVHEGKNLQIDIRAIRAQHQPHVPGIAQSEQAPANFPVSVYSNNIISTYFSQTTGKRPPVSNGTITTRDDAGTAFAWYQNLLIRENWTIDKDTVKVPASRQNKMFLLKAKKGNIDLSITCVKPERAPFAVINITAMTITK